MNSSQNKYGYACINLSLGKKVKTSRTCRKATFQEKGIPYVSELALANVQDLCRVIQWNVDNCVEFYRMSSNLFPWMSEYEFADLPDYQAISATLKEAGNIALEAGQRISFHPGPFNVLCSPKQSVVDNTIDELNKHGQIMDMMGLPRDPYYHINIHVNGVYGDKESALQRFCDNFQHLQDCAKQRLVVENDDKPSQYSVHDLYHGVHKVIGIPITFDYHHHRFCDGGLTEQAALELALSTWGSSTPGTHYSSSRTLEDSTAIGRAHADYVHEHIDTYGHTFDIMLECKAKDLALLRYRESLVETIA